MAVDGDIKLSVSLDSSASKKSARDLGQTIESALSSSSPKIRNLGVQLQKIEGNLNSVNSQMRELERTKTPTQEFSALSRDIESTYKSLLKVQSQMDSMRSAGMHVTPTSEYKRLQEDAKWVSSRINKLSEGTDKQLIKRMPEINALRAELVDIRGEMEALRDSGQAYAKSPAFIQKEQEAKRLEVQLDRLNAKSTQLQQSGGAYITGADTAKNATLSNKRTILGSQLESVARQVEGASAGSGQFLTKLKSVAAVLSMVKSKAGAVFSFIQQGFQSATNAVKSHHKTADFSFKKLLTTLLKYGLGVRSIFFLYRRIRAIISEGLKSLGKEFSPVQDQLDAFQVSFNALKSGMVGAFQPIFSFVIPALNALIGYLTSAMNALANFFAILTGQGFFYKAVKNSKTLAKNIGGAGGAAKEAAKDIAEYDKLIVIKNNDSAGGGGGGGGGAADPFNWEKTEAQTNSFIEKLKTMWDVFKQAWEDKGYQVVEAFKYALNSVWLLIQDIGNTFYRVFMDGYGYSWLISLFDMLKEMLLLVGDIAGYIKQAWDNNENGYKLIASIFNVVTSIQNAIRIIVGSLREALNSGLGVKIFEHIFHIITNINNTVAILVNKFSQAWEEGGKGRKIFVMILSIINDILQVFDEITEETKEWAKELDLNPLIQSILDFLGKLQPFLRGVLEIIKELWIDYVLPFMKNLIEKWLPAAIELLGDLFHDLAPAMKNIRDLLKEWAPVIEFLIKLGIGAFIIDVGAKLKGLLTIITLASEHLKIITFGIKGVIGIIKELPGVFISIGKAIANSPIGDGIKALIEAIKKDWNNFIHGNWSPVEMIYNLFKKGMKKFDSLNVGKYIGEGLEDGWKNFLATFSPVAALWDIFKSGFKKIFGISSPATKMKPFGKNILLGIIQGFIGAFNKVTDAVNKLKNKLGNLLKKGLDIAVNFITKLSGVATSLSGIDNLKTKFTNMYNAFKNKTATFTSTLSGAATKIDDLVDIKGKFTELHDKWEGAKATFSTFIGGAIKNINELSTNKDSWLSKFTKLHNKWKDGSAKFSVASIFNGAKQGIDTLQKGDDSWLGKFNKLYNGWKDKNANAKFNASFNKSQDEISGYASAISTLASSWQSKSATFSLSTQINAASIQSTIQTVKQYFKQAFSTKAQRSIFDQIFALGGIITPQGVTRFASGGVIANGISRLWNSIPKFASGGTAHGTMFIAGEAGPEIVGHIGNRTEVLNKSQLAATMLAAVKDGMLSAMRSVLPAAISLDYTPFLDTLNSTPIPVIVKGQVLPVNQAFMTKLDAENKTLSNIESMLQSLVGTGNEDNHDPIRLEIDGRLFAELIWSEQEKKYKQSGRYSPRYV